jgi:hypothetical protein
MSWCGIGFGYVVEDDDILETVGTEDCYLIPSVASETLEEPMFEMQMDDIAADLSRVSVSGGSAAAAPDDSGSSYTELHRSVYNDYRIMLKTTINTKLTVHVGCTIYMTVFRNESVPTIAVLFTFNEPFTSRTSFSKMVPVDTSSYLYPPSYVTQEHMVKLGNALNRMSMPGPFLFHAWLDEPTD